MTDRYEKILKTLARYEPDTVYIGTGEYVAECVRADDGDYYLAADVDAEIEKLRAEVERLKSMTAMTMGVGSGDGNLFVHGDYESIKAAQAIVLEQNALRAENERLRISMDAMQGANDALLAAGEDHDDFEAMVARIILDRDALRQRVAALEEALRDFLHLLDGQTEPLHPVSWLATVEAGKRALLGGAAPTE